MAEISWRAGGFGIRNPTLAWAVPLTSCPGRPGPLVPLSLRPRSNSNPSLSFAWEAALGFLGQGW